MTMSRCYKDTTMSNFFEQETHKRDDPSGKGDDDSQGNDDSQGGGGGGGITVRGGSGRLTQSRSGGKGVGSGVGYNEFEGRKMVDARDERRSGDDVPGGEDGGDNEQVL